MTYIIDTGARKEELYAYLLLKDYLFQNKQVRIGDNGQNGLPDVYSTDFQVGLEVTRAETPKTFEIASKLFGTLKNNDFDTTSLRFVSHKPKHNHLKQAKGLAGANYKTRNRYEAYTSEQVLDEFEFVLNKKFSKLNNRESYNAVQKKNLIILSDYIYKDFITIEDYKDIYDNVATQYDIKFDNVFITLNNELYAINAKGNMALLSDYDDMKKFKKHHNYQTNFEF